MGTDTWVSGKVRGTDVSPSLAKSMHSQDWYKQLEFKKREDIAETMRESKLERIEEI